MENQKKHRRHSQAKTLESKNGSITDTENV